MHLVGLFAFYFRLAYYMEESCSFSASSLSPCLSLSLSISLSLSLTLFLCLSLTLFHSPCLPLSLSLSPPLFHFRWPRSSFLSQSLSPSLSHSYCRPLSDIYIFLLLPFYSGRFTDCTKYISRTQS